VVFRGEEDVLLVVDDATVVRINADDARVVDLGRFEPDHRTLKLVEVEDRRHEPAVVEFEQDLAASDGPVEQFADFRSAVGHRDSKEARRAMSLTDASSVHQR